MRQRHDVPEKRPGTPSPARRIQPWLAAGVVLAACLAAVPPAVLAATGTSQRQLQVDGRVRQVLAANLDEDSLQDLLVLHVTGQGRRARRWASVFWQGQGGAFSPRPNLTWELAPEVVAVDLFTPEGGGPAQVYVLRTDGAYHYTLRRGVRPPTAERLAELPLGHLQPSVDDVFSYDFARTWRQGGGLELLVPTVPYPTLLHPADGRKVILPVPPEAAYTAVGMWDAPDSAVSGRLRFPMPVPADQDGDGKPDLVFLGRERLLVVRLAEVSPEGVAAVRGFDLDLLDPKEAEMDPFAVLTRLVDLQGDGRVDLVASVFRDSGMFELEGRLLVFHGRPDGTFPQQPDQVLEVDHGQYPLTLIQDLTGDNLQELVVPSAKVGVLGLIKLLTSRKLSFNLDLFEQARDGKLGEQRSVRSSLRALISDRNDVSAVFFAEVTGDRLLDLVIGSEPGQMCIHPGEITASGWGFESRPATCLDGDPFARYQHEDLDGDGREELIGFGVRGETAGRVTVTFVRP